MRATVRHMAMLAVATLAASSAAGADFGSPVADYCPEALEARYFPVGPRRPGGDDHGSFARRWYASDLDAMEKPSLSCGSLEDTEAYRFLWLRSFHDDIAVRLFRRGDDYGLEAVILDRAGRYSANYRRWLSLGTGDYERPGNASRRVTKALSRDQWQAVIVRL